jgi:hypothetical protein
MYIIVGVCIGMTRVSIKHMYNIEKVLLGWRAPYVGRYFRIRRESSLFSTYGKWKTS